MKTAGYFMAFLLCVGGLAVAQAIFWKMTGRAFWRAMVPQEWRFAVKPDDPVRMDSFMQLEEWAALLFCGAFLVLPLIALDTLGFIAIFH
ncbi:MAG: hypothetical protein OZSIB_2686 [Candidatus Ozemobacter sibiricus]|jgi:hypothetical protein|uniref:Uncharacterized protein n=1 Tax=Candidatus Ozemobacter sibiricus TaxID=2268124 RepID=A0A367ZRQ4_9BACT|nr:MAG: hypothetical protein OZSIB_2686 [Candidatus Ozemobacter sibiricus]